MKKIIAIILSTLTLLFCLSGCVYENINVKLNKNGSGSIGVSIGIEKEFYNNNLKDSGVFDGKETTEIEYEDKTYVTFTDTKEYETFEQIEDALKDMTYIPDDYSRYFDIAEIENELSESDDEADGSASKAADSHIFKSVEIKKDGSVYVFNAVLNKVEGEYKGYELSECFTFGVTVEMPTKVAAYKNGKVDGRKVTFDLSKPDKEIELYAECTVASKVPAIIGIVLAAGAAVAFFVFRRKK